MNIYVIINATLSNRHDVFTCTSLYHELQNSENRVLGLLTIHTKS